MPTEFSEKSETQKALEEARRRQAELAAHAEEVAKMEGSKRKPTPEEIKEAKAIIADYLAAGEYPKITVARRHLEEILEKGLKARPTAYQKDVKLIVGTLGREAFLPHEQDRVILEVHTDPKRVVPRFTGESKAFEGVVAIQAEEIPPENLRVIDPKEPGEGREKAA